MLHPVDGRAVGPCLDGIEAELAALSALREKPAGTIRITAHDHAVRTVLWPALVRLRPGDPDVKVEVAVAAGLTDIVAGRLDAGIRTGEMVAQDMVAVRIGPDMRRDLRLPIDTEANHLRLASPGSGKAAKF